MSGEPVPKSWPCRVVSADSDGHVVLAFDGAPVGLTVGDIWKSAPFLLSRAPPPQSEGEKS